MESKEMDILLEEISDSEWQRMSPKVARDGSPKAYHGGQSNVNPEEVSLVGEQPQVIMEAALSQTVPDIEEITEEVKSRGKNKPGKKERLRFKKRKEEMTKTGSHVDGIASPKPGPSGLVPLNKSRMVNCESGLEATGSPPAEVPCSPRTDLLEPEDASMQIDSDSEEELGDPNPSGLYYKLIVVHTNFPRIKLDSNNLQQFKLNLVETIEEATIERERINPPLSRDEWRNKINEERRKKRKIERELRQAALVNTADGELNQAEGLVAPTGPTAATELKADECQDSSVSKSKYDNKKDEDTSGDIKVMSSKVKEGGFVITCFNIPTREWIKNNLDRLGGRDDVTGQMLSFKTLSQGELLERKSIKIFIPLKRINEGSLLDSLRRFNSSSHLDTVKWSIIAVRRASNGATGYTVIISVDKESLILLKRSGMKLWYGCDRLKIKELTEEKGNKRNGKA